MDTLLADVEHAREAARLAEARAKELEESAKLTLRDAAEREAHARQAAARAKSVAAEEAERLLREADAMVKETRRRLVDAPAASATEVEAAGRVIRDKQREVVSERARAAPATPVPESERVRAEDVAPGMELWSLDLDTVVQTAAPPDGRGIVRVLMGSFRLELPLDRLRLVPLGRQRASDERGGSSRGRGVVTHVAPAEAVATELDLRGQSGDEAVDALEQYIDRALLAGLGVVRIIHGKGTGVLRQRVREVLSKHFAVVDSRLGEPAEGGDGVTIVHLADR
jgi:DNA mismatch repair protein MutS2